MSVNAKKLIINIQNQDSPSPGTTLTVPQPPPPPAADHQHGSSAEELGPPGSRPPLRQASSTPDIVRASRPGLGTKYDEDTIDKLLARPQKIRIPERYVPELVSGLSCDSGLGGDRMAGETGLDREGPSPPGPSNSISWVGPGRT